MRRRRVPRPRDLRPRDLRAAAVAFGRESLPRPLPPAPSCVWRDALGPGYAVGVSETVAGFVASTAAKPYHCRT